MSPAGWSIAHAANPNRAAARTVVTRYPRFRADMGASASRAGTTSTPTIDASTPKLRATSGKTIPAIPKAGKSATPRTIAPMFSAAVDSNRSAPRPAQSPTLSPTRSATTAGVRGSSPGVPPPALPDQVGTDVCCLRVDPAPQLREQGDEGRAEAEADHGEDDRLHARGTEPGVVQLEGAPHPAKAECDDREPRDRAPAQGRAKGAAKGRAPPVRRRAVRADRDVHPDVAAGGGEGGAERERNRRAQAVLGPSRQADRHGEEDCHDGGDDGNR